MSDRPNTKHRWIITGANGYLGGQLCKALHSRGEKVFAVARSCNSLKPLEKVGISCHVYEELPAILSSGDVFVHCAGKVGSNGTWDEFVKVNRDWSVSLFDMASEHGVMCFFYVSSVAALGFKPRSEDVFLDESSLAAHMEGDFYGRSKLLAEQELQERARSSSTRLIILRPGLIYGRRHFVSSQSWIKRSVVVDPEQRVPLVHIDNFTEAIVGVSEQPEAQGIFLVVDEEQPKLCNLNAIKLKYGILAYAPWYIGRTGFCLTWFCRALVRTLCGRINKNFKDQVIAEYYFATRRLLYSTEKLRSQVGWTSSVTLESGLKECSTAATAARKRK